MKVTNHAYKMSLLILSTGGHVQSRKARRFCSLWCDGNVSAENRSIVSRRISTHEVGLRLYHWHTTASRKCFIWKYIYIIYSQAIRIIWYKCYWHNSCLKQYKTSNRTHINPARSRPYPNPKYISFNMWLWIQVHYIVLTRKEWTFSYVLNCNNRNLGTRLKPYIPNLCSLLLQICLVLHVKLNEKRPIQIEKELNKWQNNTIISTWYRYGKVYINV